MSQPEYLSQGSAMYPSSKRKATSKPATAKRARPSFTTLKGVGSQVSIASKAAITRPLFFKSHQTGFPQRYKESLRFTSVVGFNVAGATYAEPVVVYLNGPYSPLGGAGQPAAWTKLMAIYTKCVALNCKVTWTLTDVDGSTTSPALAGISISTTSGSLNTYTQAITQGLETHTIFSQNPDTKTLTQTCDISKFLGVKDLTDGTDYNNTDAALPSQVVVAHCWTYGMHSIAVTGTLVSLVTVDYDCIFYDPKSVT